MSLWSSPFLYRWGQLGGSFSTFPQALTLASKGGNFCHHTSLLKEVLCCKLGSSLWPLICFSSSNSEEWFSHALRVSRVLGVSPLPLPQDSKSCVLTPCPTRWDSLMVLSCGSRSEFGEGTGGLHLGLGPFVFALAYLSEGSSCGGNWVQRWPLMNLVL